MDFKFKGITWVGDFYQKFEEVCQEVDDIVGKDAVKYLGNQVQNVGDSVKRFYSDVVQEVLPLPPLVNSEKHGHLSLTLNSNVDSPLESVAAVAEDYERVEENPVNNTIVSSHVSDANNLTSNQHAQASIGPDPANQVNDENFSNSCEVADSGATQEEVGDDDSRETSGIMKKDLNVSLEQNAVKSTPELWKNMMCLNDKEPLESSTFSESLYGLTSSEVALSTMPSESSRSSESDGLSARSQGSYCSEIDSCRGNSVDTAGCSLDSSMVLVSCTSTPDVGVAGEFMTSQAGLLSCGGNKSMESNEGETSVVDEVMPSNNLPGTGLKHGQIPSAQESAIISDERLADSIESIMEDIQLSDDDIKLDESCIFVDDMELHAASSRVRKLRSYKKRIKDVFGRKKRIEKEYEQLAIWYGDSDIEFNDGTSQSGMPFSFPTSLDSKNLQVQNLSETEWQLL
ncbi:uncharacterized protein LOC114721972 [Neltuma alba]|uniref:uncharacterized protein LOC114721972 n=1 Tax=Neltuma alba TaxID=207710 RepID=UPI0010A44EF7|nr:uncharacterized protein LOC114721972 [Prosopis alba]XP_028763700.1 uncharacterized protein LOC114721972 [Prosopis alba]XP_028763701.1 uncharacterized protein LOC114721972 [Prosopis alba]